MISPRILELIQFLLLWLLQQRLGAITLEQDDDQAIQLFEWNGIAVARANALETQISSLAVKYREAEETIAKLNNQLEDLVQTKNDHDDQLIAKFAQLLNEKKLKIRNQQRLLASATINTDKGLLVSGSVSGSVFHLLPALTRVAMLTSI